MCLKQYLAYSTAAMPTRPGSLSSVDVFRPPNIHVHVGGLIFFRPLISELAKRTKPYPAIWLEVSVIWKCMSEIWGIPSAYKSGTQKSPFRRFRNLKATLTAYIYGTKYDIHKRVNALTTTPCPKKTVQNYFCQNVVKSPPILIIFGRKMAKRLKLCRMHSLSTTSNLCHHTTVLNACAPNC